MTSDVTSVLTVGELVLPAIWLRDACSCPACRHPGTGQRLVGAGRLDAATSVARYDVRAGQLDVVFAPDGHASSFGLGWLARNAPGRAGQAGRAGDRSERSRVLWTGADLPTGPPRLAWDAYLRSPAVMRGALGAVSELGVAVLTEVPARASMVLTVARSFGHVRTTNYGELFDVRVETDPEHLAYTAGALAPHTDNPYRDPVPTVQLLHCLRAAGDGGDTVLVDGFAAARRLRARDAAAFDALTRVSLTFRYDSPTVALAAYAPTISVDGEGAITQIRWNDRAAQPPRIAPDRIPEMYRALAAFDDVLAEPDLAVTSRLRPGDCLIVDNTRILHGRTAFSATATATDTGAGARAGADARVRADAGGGARHLQGCYADLDGLRSTLEMLREARTDQPADGPAAAPRGPVRARA